MRPGPILRALWPSRAFRQALGQELGADRSAALWDAVRDQQAALRGRRPRVRSPGLALLLRYLEWDCALYRVLRREGRSEAEAGARIEAINWAILGPPIALAHALSRLRSGRRARRVAWLLDALFAVVFTAPFRRRQVTPHDGLTFDVLACPLADYFRQQGVPELTRYAACRLDYRMADAWGMQLHRAQTLADGGALCDFRFRVMVEPPTARSGHP